MTVIIVIVAVLILLITLWITFPPVRIFETSMFPTFMPGEIFFGTRLVNPKKLKVGDVILYHAPDSDRIVIKRIHKIKEEREQRLFYCLGDNPKESHDSRHYGFISSKDLVCVPLRHRENLNKNAESEVEN